METVQIQVNGRTVEAGAGEMLLDCLRREGVEVPTLCHHPLLTPYGGCRMCVVARRDGRSGLVPACATPVQRGMVVETEAPEVVASRRQQLQLLLLDHRMDCPVCERSGDCRLQDLVYRYGTPEQALPFARAPRAKIDNSPVIVRDPEKCILCGTCVRLCDEVQGVAAIGLVDRGLRSRVTTMLDRPLDCEFCGQCVNACPVGALVARPYASATPAWRRERTVTTCSYCSCGCQLVVESCEGRLLGISGDGDLAPNQGRLCAKGWLGGDVLTNPRRLQSPMLRREGRLVPVSWDEAVEALASGLRRAVAERQPVVAVGSSRLTTEEAYLLQRLVRTGLASPHVHAGPSGGRRALVEGMLPATGQARSSAGFEDLEQADFVLVLRADPSRTHPLVKTSLVRGIRRRGQRVVLVHALSGALDQAAQHLRVRPGSEADLLYGLCAVFAGSGGSATGDGAAELRTALEAYTPAAVAAATGLQADQVPALAAELAAARKVVAVVLNGLGIPGDEGAVARAAADLMRLLGPSAGGVLVLGERCNQQGVVDAGLDPELLPGHRRAGSASDRAEVGARWGVEPPAEPAWDLRQAMERCAAGEVGVLWLVGQDPVGSWPSRFPSTAALAGAGLVVVQDAFLTSTARKADLVLPVKLLLERGGSVTSADGEQRVLRPAVAALECMPSDGELLAEVARRLGAPLPAADELAREVAELTVPVRREPGGFSAPTAPATVPEAEGILLDASPQLFHSGSSTTCSALLEELASTLAVRLNPQDAAELGLGPEDAVSVASGDRELLLRWRADATIRRGTVQAPWHNSGDSAASLLVENGHPTTVTVRRSQ